MSPHTALLREHSLSLFRAGIAAANPRTAVAHSLSTNNNTLQLRLDFQDSNKIRTGAWSKIHLLAFGKAACTMADAAQQSIPVDRLAGKGLAVTTYENIAAVDNIEVIGAGHPLPDANGLAAAQKVAQRISSAKANELVLVMISGGGSALLPRPVDGISLKDKTAITELLLSSGATINQINCVRKHLSKIKGGGLAKLAAPADLHALILSDVLGDDLSAIASGPTVADDTTFADAIKVFNIRQIWNSAPISVQNHLEQGAQGLKPETLKSTNPLLKTITHTLIGSNALSVDAALQISEKLGYRSRLYSKQLCGEARQVAEELAIHCKHLIETGLTEPTALIAGGETTVTLTGKGKGGRNQEMALAFALSAEHIGLTGDWTFLSGGTDGRDGPTDAAGGLVDAHTLLRIRKADIDPQAALTNNDSYPALQAANDLLITGPTGTNVADLQIVLLYPSTE